MMKAFLTGASGILGSDIKKELSVAGYSYLSFDSTNLDLSDLPSIESLMLSFSPDVVIHCAALTNVDACEDNRDTAYAVNVTGTKNMAICASKVNARMIFISSCGVYGNSKDTPYNETDSTNPLNYHHYTKLEGEKMVTEYSRDHIIVRPGWLFGGTTAHKKNFVEARRKEAQKVTELSSAADKIGSPTYTSDLAKQIFYLIDQKAAGVFNTVNEGCASRYDYICEIVKILGYNTLVKPVKSNEFLRRAEMPDNECLENYNLNAAGFNRMRCWKDALREYITTTYNL